jgi:hypothetical protein
VCQTLSNAWDLSRKAADQYCLVFFNCFVNLVHYSVCLLDVDESQIGGQVGLVGFQLRGEVCGGEVSRRLWREWEGG